MNRAQAIQTLEAQGLHAKQRTCWSLGDSIFVGALPFEAGGIKGHKVGVYLYPHTGDESVWWITAFRVPEAPIKCGALEDAVEIAAARVAAEARRIEAERE